MVVGDLSQNVKHLIVLVLFKETLQMFTPLEVHQSYKT